MQNTYSFWLKHSIVFIQICRTQNTYLLLLRLVGSWFFLKLILIIFCNFVYLWSIQIFELTRNSEKMDISEISSSLEHIPLPPDQKKAILQLIDAKINNDMKEVIAKLNELEGKLEVKIQMTNDKLSNEIKIVYWVIGIAMAVIMFVVARK